MTKLLLLHGALGSKGQTAQLESALNGAFEIFTLNFSGHGGAPITNNFGIEGFTKEALDFLNEKEIDRIDIFGYSMGGYVALNLARTSPERVGSIITLATKFDWTPEAAAREVKMLDPEKIEAKIPAFANLLTERHAPTDWKILMRKTAEMMLALGERNFLTTNVLQKIHHPTLVCLGDSDQMISREETEQAAAALPNGRLHIFENTPHPFEKMDVLTLAAMIKSVFKNDSL